jgi:hypothetical protein
MLYKQLDELAISGLYAVVNETDRYVYVGFGSCILKSYAKIVSEIKLGTFRSKRMIEDIDKLDFRVLEENNDYLSRFLRLTYWVDLYLSQGYTLYCDMKRLKMELRIIPDYDNSLVKVVLQSSNKKRIVGIFNHTYEAEAFVAVNYPDPFYNIVYADNKLTSDYLYEINRSLVL